MRTVRRRHGMDGFRLAALGAAAVVLAACAPLPPEETDEPSPISAPRLDLDMDDREDTAGGMFDEERPMRLFEDRSARREGDLITVRIEEQTEGDKAISSSMEREAGADLPAPVIGGQDLEIAGRPFQFEQEGEANFEGSGSAEQSTNLSGTVTAVVVDTLPNGHLVIRGEKAVTVSQGTEQLQIQGIVRTDDVGANNEISSNQVANMQLSYTGSDTIDDTAKPGWLTRFLMRRL